MSLLIAILVALSAVAATPETESPQFVADIILHCTPRQYADFVGCEVAPGYPGDEPGYAGYSTVGPVTGP